jgi:hypothetical protein
MDSDLIFGVFVTVIFLALVFGAGVLLYKFKNMRFVKAWQPLVPIIGGSIRGDGGGAATSWLSGTYKGKDVHASMSPNANDSGRSGSTMTGFAFNAFELILRDVPGTQDWSITYHIPLLGGAGQEWRISTKDTALQERLQAQGIVNLVASLGYPSAAAVGAGLPVLRYTAREAQLHYREDAGSEWLPTPDRFREELETLLRVASINAQVNAA